MNTKNIIALVVGLAFAGLVLFATFPVITWVVSSSIGIFKNESVTARLEHQVAEMNEGLPQIVREGVRLDSVVLKSKRTIAYYSTFYEYDKNEAPYDEVVGQEAIVKNLKENRKSMRFAIDNDVLLYYHYYDKNKQFVAKIKITPAMYK